MIRINLSPEPQWFELGHGVRLQLLPLTTALMVATRSDAAVQALDESASNDTRAAVFAAALARRAVICWEGVGDESGAAITVTPEGIDALLSLWPIFEAFNLHYVSAACCWMRKKTTLRPCRLALQRGDSYCQACETQCPDCPTRLNQPLSHDGWQVWDLVGRLGGQMRVTGKAVLGWDMGAALALGHALGLNPMVMAELLPELEAVMVRRINEKIGGSE